MTGTRRVWTRLALAAYVAALALVSLLPSGSQAPGGWDASISPGLQNLLHVPAYTALVLLAAWAVPAARRGPVLALLAVACCAYGVALEFAQGYIPGRTGTATDALLNAAGAVLGLLAFWAVGRRSRARAKRTRPCAAEGSPV